MTTPFPIRPDPGTPITEPGFYDLTAERYHADPCAVPSLSASMAKILIGRSPAHAYYAHPRLGAGGKKFDATAEMEFGSIVHELLLGKGGGFAVWEGDSWRTKDSQAFKAAAEATGRIPIKREQMTKAEACAAAARCQLDALGLAHALREGRNEVVAIWRDGATTCRAMMDNLILDLAAQKAEIYDLKTTSKSAHPKACTSQVLNMNYDLAESFYKRAIEVLHPSLSGRITFTFLFLETEPPFILTAYQTDGTGLAVGQSKAIRAQQCWDACVKAGVWPAYSTTIVKGETPEWQINQEFGQKTILPPGTPHFQQPETENEDLEEKTP